MVIWHEFVAFMKSRLCGTVYLLTVVIATNTANK